MTIQTIITHITFDQLMFGLRSAKIPIPIKTKSIDISAMELGVIIKCEEDVDTELEVKSFKEDNGWP